MAGIRLLGHIGMEIFYCDSCGSRIDRDCSIHGPFRNPRGQIFCRNCKTEDAVAVVPDNPKHLHSAPHALHGPDSYLHRTVSNNVRSESACASPIRRLIPGALALIICILCFMVLRRQTRPPSVSNPPPEQNAPEDPAGNNPQALRLPATLQQLAGRWNFVNPDGPTVSWDFMQAAQQGDFTPILRNGFFEIVDHGLRIVTTPQHYLPLMIHGNFGRNVIIHYELSKLQAIPGTSETKAGMAIGFLLAWNGEWGRQARSAIEIRSDLWASSLNHHAAGEETTTLIKKPYLHYTPEGMAKRLEGTHRIVLRENAIQIYHDDVLSIDTTFHIAFTDDQTHIGFFVKNGKATFKNLRITMLPEQP